MTNADLEAILWSLTQSHKDCEQMALTAAMETVARMLLVVLAEMRTLEQRVAGLETPAWTWLGKKG